MYINLAVGLLRWEFKKCQVRRMLPSWQKCQMESWIATDEIILCRLGNADENGYR